MPRHAPSAMLAALVALALPAGTASAGLLATPALPQASVYQTVAAMQMTVGHAYAHLREKPTSKSALLATLKQGTKVEVLDKVHNSKGEWAHVKVDGKEGYIAMNLLK